EIMKLFGKGIPPVFDANTFYVFEYFVIVVVLAVGAYIAYVSAGSVVDDVLYKTGAVNLSLPMPRWKLLLSRIIANFILAVVVMAVSLLISTMLLVLVADRPLTLKNVTLLHLMGIIYAASVISLATLLGTILPITLAKSTAAGIVLAMYILDTMTLNTSLENLGYLTLTRYYPVLEIAVHGTLKTADAIILALATTILTVAAIVLYRRKDIPV
ncbi:MAG: ABC transporter permease subunit, partial [Thermoprotei archaeon]|nr:ABC transporter permease subunit [Thermoprotei archaeon]